MIRPALPWRFPVPIYNSVISKEARTRMRGWGALVLVTVYMVVFAAIALTYLFQDAGPTAGQISPVGLTLFQILAALQMLLILVIVPSSTAGAISGERQRQTWDLLLITRLSPLGIVLGKLTAGIAFNILLIFAALPIFSLVFLFGGVAPGDIVDVYIVFLATVLLIGSYSIFISSVSRRLAGALVAANVLTLVLTFGLTALTIYLRTSETTANGGVTAPLTPLAQIDPIVALFSAVPTTVDGTNVVNLGMIHHAFGLFGTIPFWEAYAILSVVISAVLALLTAYFARSTVPWLSRGGS